MAVLCSYDINLEKRTKKTFCCCLSMLDLAVKYGNIIREDLFSLMLNYINLNEIFLVFEKPSVAFIFLLEIVWSKIIYQICVYFLMPFYKSQEIDYRYFQNCRKCQRWRSLRRFKLVILPKVAVVVPSNNHSLMLLPPSTAPFCKRCWLVHLFWQIIDTLSLDGNNTEWAT